MSQPTMNAAASEAAQPASAAAAAARMADNPIQRPDYRLGDNLWAREGQVFMTGTQALVRLM